MPRKTTGSVPERWTRRADAPLGKAVIGAHRSDNGRDSGIDEGQRTVDIGSWRERWVVGEHLGYIVVCAVDIVIFLEAKQVSQSVSQSIGWLLP